MGQEISAVLRDRKTHKVIEECPLFVCGRYSAVNYLANIIEHKDRDVEKERGKDFDGCDDYCSYGGLAFNEPGFMKSEEHRCMFEQLHDYQEEDERELAKATRRLDQCLAAQRNARTYEEFCSFDAEIENADDFINDYFSHAERLLEMARWGENKLIQYKAYGGDGEDYDPEFAFLL